MVVGMSITLLLIEQIMRMVLLLLMLYPFFNSCSVNTCQMKKDRLYNITEDNKEDWRIDSCGCLGLRSIALAKSLIEDYGLEGNSREEFEKVFGKPNVWRTEQTQIVLVYYFNSICDDDNRPRKGADKCWMEFVFENNQLKEIPKYYSIE